MKRLQSIAVILVILLAGIAIPFYFAGYHESLTKAESSNLSVKTPTIGNGTVASLFKNVTAKLVYRKGKTYLEAEGELVSSVNLAPIANQTVYMTCSTNLYLCGSTDSTTNADGSFDILLPVSLGCGQQVNIELSWQGTSYYAPYGNNYLVTNGCPSEPLA